MIVEHVVVQRVLSLHHCSYNYYSIIQTLLSLIEGVVVMNKIYICVGCLSNRADSFALDSDSSR
jgi:hypothetical protein